jgi:hypothetical protein
MVMPRFMGRLEDPAKRPPGSLPVEMLVMSYPIATPGRDDPATETAGGTAGRTAGGTDDETAAGTADGAAE